MTKDNPSVVLRPSSNRVFTADTMTSRVRTLSRRTGSRSAVPLLVLLLVCGLSLMVPCRAFNAYWNVPSSTCANFGVTLDLESYGITSNENQSTFGEVVDLFFELGKFPKIAPNGTWINGGVPQNGNLTDHLQTTYDDVINLIPDVNFNGLAVIDFEDWRPVWPLTGGTQQIYKDASLQLVRDEHPDWSERLVQQVAKREYEAAGRFYLLATLEMGKRMRPRAKWGYYGYPYVDNYDTGRYNVSAQYRRANDELQRLYNDSTVFYPSVYVFKGNLTSEERTLQVQGRLDETFRLRKNLSVPIVPYFWFSYHEVNRFLAYDDLVATMGTVYDAGLDVIIWGGLSQVNSKEKCNNLKKYLDSTLGPYVQSLVLNPIVDNDVRAT